MSVSSVNGTLGNSASLSSSSPTVPTSTSSSTLASALQNAGQTTTSSSSPPPSSSIPTSNTSTVLASTTQSASQSEQTRSPVISQTSNASSLTPTSAAPHTTSLQSAGPQYHHGLSSGAVAGAVIGVAVGVALLTFLITFVLMRRKHRQPVTPSQGVPVSREKYIPPSEPKDQFIALHATGRDLLTNYLPQSADDVALRNAAKSALDHLGLFVENFYQDHAKLPSQPLEIEVAAFESQSLPGPLNALLQISRTPTLIIRHALAHSSITSISPQANPAHSLLPAEFTLLPHKIAHPGSTVDRKPGFEQGMSRWREITAYLRPNPFHDEAYIAQRDRQIKVKVRAFLQAFAPWERPAHSQQERSSSLSAILKSVAELGILLFSQPSELQFRWPRPEELSQDRIAILPALVKLTDERGRRLKTNQTLVQAVVE